MPSGACVVEYHGARGVVFRAKYRDANGRQVQRTLGSAARGWTRTKAERELGKLLDEVARERWTKPTRETVAAFADEWRRVWLPARQLKRSTVIDYANTLDRHVLPALGHLELDRVGPEHLDGYVAAKRAEGLSSKTIANHIGTLNVMFTVAKRWRRVRANPLDDVDRPRLDPPETVILSAEEVARLLAAYRELGAAADGVEAAWWPLARRMALVVLGTALRRGELLALRWQDVELLERRLHVRRS